MKFMQTTYWTFDDNVLKAFVPLKMVAKPVYQSDSGMLILILWLPQMECFEANYV